MNYLALPYRLVTGVQDLFTWGSDSSGTSSPTSTYTSSAAADEEPQAGVPAEPHVCPDTAPDQAPQAEPQAHSEVPLSALRIYAVIPEQAENQTEGYLSPLSEAQLEGPFEVAAEVAGVPAVDATPQSKADTNKQSDAGTRDLQDSSAGPPAVKEAASQLQMSQLRPPTGARAEQVAYTAFKHGIIAITQQEAAATAEASAAGASSAEQQQQQCAGTADAWSSAGQRKGPQHG